MIRIDVYAATINAVRGAVLASVSRPLWYQIEGGTHAPLWDAITIGVGLGCLRQLRGDAQ
jgi:hypothetical protein